MLDYTVKKREQEGNLINEDEMSKLKTDICVSEASPSEVDIFSMIKSSVFFYKHQPKGRITHKVCSSYGIAEYYLTEWGRGYYKDMEPIEIIFSRLFSRSLAQLHVDYDEPSDISKIEAYCKDLSQDTNTTVIFAPYEKFLAPTSNDN